MSDSQNDDDPVARKLKERDQMIAADMDNAASLLGTTTTIGQSFAPQYVSTS